MILRRRPAKSEDFEFCFRAIEEGLRDYVIETFAHWDDASERRKLYQRQQQNQYELVEVDSEAVGCCCIIEKPDCLYLELIALYRRHQGRGIGTLFMEQVLTEARSVFLPVVLRCIKSNPAKSLYDRLGFAVIEEQDVRWIMRHDGGSKS